jgi:hypothetical protein
MCSSHSYNKDEAELRLRDKIICPGRILKINRFEAA